MSSILKETNSSASLSDVDDSNPCPATAFHALHVHPSKLGCHGSEDCLVGLHEHHCIVIEVRKLEDILKVVTWYVAIIQECINGFKCGNECNLSQWVCDGEQDCANGSDEKEGGE